jgi:hypothetical protein
MGVSDMSTEGNNETLTLLQLQRLRLDKEAEYQKAQSEYDVKWRQLKKRSHAKERTVERKELEELRTKEQIIFSDLKALDARIEKLTPPSDATMEKRLRVKVKELRDREREAKEDVLQIPKLKQNDPRRTQEGAFRAEYILRRDERRRAESELKGLRWKMEVKKQENERAVKVKEAVSGLDRSAAALKTAQSRLDHLNDKSPNFLSRLFSTQESVIWKANFKKENDAYQASKIEYKKCQDACIAQLPEALQDRLGKLREKANDTEERIEVQKRDIANSGGFFQRLRGGLIEFRYYSIHKESLARLEKTLDMVTREFDAAFKEALSGSPTTEVFPKKEVDRELEMAGSRTRRNATIVGAGALDLHAERHGLQDLQAKKPDSGHTVDTTHDNRPKGPTSPSS